MSTSFSRPTTPRSVLGSQKCSVISFSGRSIDRDYAILLRLSLILRTLKRSFYHAILTCISKNADYRFGFSFSCKPFVGGFVMCYAVLPGGGVGCLRTIPGSVTFRPWLDAARIMFLLMAHIGTAGTFAYWYPRFKCLSQDPDQEDVCKLIIAYILIASWLVPILLMIYGAGLALMVWRHRISASETPLVADEESHAQCRLSLPHMKQKTTPNATFSRPISSWEHVSNVSSSSRYSEPLSTRKSSTLENDSPVAARLSKPPPAFHF